MANVTIHAQDIPIVHLKPLRERKITRREYERIKASIEAVGLIEPLVVSPEGDSFLILDGVQRYRQYSVDLLKLVIYARSLVTSPVIREYLDEHHPAIVTRFTDIIAQAQA